MGWFSKRFMRNRAKWGKPISEEKRRALLRRIAVFIRRSDSLFDTHYVELECGHRTSCYGETRARCVECLREKERQGCP